MNETKTSHLAIPVIEIKQNIGTFYAGSMDARMLHKMCKFDFRRIVERGNYNEFLGIQRKLNPKRVDEIKKYITTVDAVFPTAIVIAVDGRTVQLDREQDGCARLKFSQYADNDDPNKKINIEDIASIIDGQHRLKAFEDYDGEPFYVNVSIFVDIDEATKAEIFSTVNLAQTKVNKSLAYDLLSISAKRSPEKTCHEITVALDRMSESPFYQLIKRLGTATEGRTGETLSQATVVRGLLPYISGDPLLDRDIGKRGETWRELSEKQLEKHIFYPFFKAREDEAILRIVLNYFKAVQERWPQAWESDGTGAMIKRTNGFNGLIRFLRPAYRYFTTSNKIVSQRDFRELFDRVDLRDQDFNTEEFPPGTSGASKLYRKLKEHTGI